MFFNLSVTKILNSMSEIKLEGLPRVEMEEKLSDKINSIYDENKEYNRLKFLAW